MVFFMNKIMLASLFFAASGPALAGERRFTVTDFDKVQVEGPFEVVLSTGKSPSAMAVGSASALDRVTVETIGRTLRVKPNRAAWGGYPGEGPGPVKLMLTVHQVRSATVSGAGSLDIDRVNGMRVDLGLSGSGRLSVGKLEADVAGANVVGSGRMTLGGAVKSFQANVQGSGDLRAEGLMTHDAQIFAESSGLIEVAAKNSAKVRSTGSGDLVVLGSPACTVQALGSGRVVCGKN